MIRDETIKVSEEKHKNLGHYVYFEWKFGKSYCRDCIFAKSQILINQRYINRDISWLSFNERVLQEAMDESVPLLERLKFLAIYSSNLDEFFRVRVANHRNLYRAGKKALRGIEEDPSEVLEKILTIVNEQQEKFSEIFELMIVPSLKKQGINILQREELNQKQIEYLETYFRDNILPHVQPVLLKEEKIKPFLVNGALYLAIIMEDRIENSDAPPRLEHSIVKIPSDSIDRFIQVPSRKSSQHDIVLLDEIVRQGLQMIFPGYIIKNSYSIKLTRDAELYIDDEFSGDLKSKIWKSLKKRQIGPPSRLVYDREIPKSFLSYFTKVLELSNFDFLREGYYHNNSDFFKFPDFGKLFLKNVELPPLPYSELENNENIFEEISQNDHLLYFPFHSYESVIRFFELAAEDPFVTHIKIVQYRVAKKSRIMNALIRAVNLGKLVSVFIEVKARFDEEANLKWGEKLEKAGVNVHYSLPGLKVHSKMAIIRRMENHKPKLYTYLSTGNFNEDTAKIYTDFGYFTSKYGITTEAMRLFSYLETKEKPQQVFENLLVGKFNLKSTLLEFIEKEIQNHKKGLPSGITLKLNSIQDIEMIESLYKASQAGVKTTLICRGICCLVAGVKGLSENISVFSIVDRYLEHSRIYMFENAGKKDIYIASADWMSRNLNNRIETAVKIEPIHLKEIIFTILRIQINDNTKSRTLCIDSLNEYRKNNDDLTVRSQLETYYYFKRLIDRKSKNII